MKHSRLEREVTAEEQVVRDTRRRVAAHKRGRLARWLVVLAVLAAVVYYGGHYLAEYMWGSP